MNNQFRSVLVGLSKLTLYFVFVDCFGFTTRFRETISYEEVSCCNDYCLLEPCSWQLGNGARSRRSPRRSWLPRWRTGIPWRRSRIPRRSWSRVPHRRSWSGILSSRASASSAPVLSQLLLPQLLLSWVLSRVLLSRNGFLLQHARFWVFHFLVELRFIRQIGACELKSRRFELQNVF